MPLLHQLPDPQVLDAYRQGIEDLTGQVPSPFMVIHLPVDIIGLKDLTGGAGFDRAKSSGCRFYAWLKSEAISCEMTYPAQFGKVAIGNIVRGDDPRTVFERIRNAQAMPQVRSRDYELRLLNISDLFLEALRLRSVVDSENLILPIRAFDEVELHKEKMLTAEQFLPIAARLAALRTMAGIERMQLGS